jgi:phosphoribosylformimino-5-aminoimidazole carboxamide ribotide isomerase
MSRVIPVLDLKEGQAVHAVRGNRAAYRPVESVLASSADPLELGHGLVSKLGARECYVADLDAILRTGDHGAAIGGLAALGLQIWLDSGTSTADAAARALARGAARVIVGTETLGATSDLEAIAAAVGQRCVLSVDLRDGRLLAGSPEVSALRPGELVALAWAAGIRTFIVLDLARVGSGEGPQLAAALALRRSFPEAEIAIGGGVRDHADLDALSREGFQGALVGTALHRGVITSLRAGSSD